MTAFIQFFCVNLLLSIALAANLPLELQFLPNDIVEVTSSSKYTKKITFQNETSTFNSSQDVRMDIYLEEESGKFPFHFTIVLNQIQFLNSKDGKAIDTSAIEKAEAQSLINRPLKFMLKNRGQPLEFEEEQKKLFGSCQIFEGRFLQALLEEDIHDLFLLTDMPLRIGGSFTLPKRIGSIEVPVTYTIKDAAPEGILITFCGKLDRTKASFQEDQIAVSGDLQGEILWNPKNRLQLTCHQKGSIQYKIKLDGQAAKAVVEYDKTVLSRLKPHD